MRFAAACLVMSVILIASQAHAEVVTIEVTVKAIDAKERTITVTKTSKTKSKDIELEVGKKAKILIDGKVDGLEAVNAGQKASVSYETELEVITKIEVGSAADAPSPDDTKTEAASLKKSGCRVVWTISETGASVLTISRPLEKRESPKEGMIRHDDGTVEYQHDFGSQESADRALMDTGVNVEFDKARVALVMSPKPIKDEKGIGARFIYSKLVQFPITLEYDFEGVNEGSPFMFGVTVRDRNSNKEFPFVNISSKDGFKTVAVIRAFWLGERDAKGEGEKSPLMDEQTVELGEPKQFTFKCPLKNGGQRYMLEYGVIGETPAALRYVSVRGRLTPTLGVALTEKSGGVIAERVLPKGLGETVGVKPGDVLMSVNGSKPKSMKEAMELLGKIRFGEESEIVVKRGGKTVKIGFTAE